MGLLESRLTQLVERHRKLDEVIAEEMTHPDWDEVKVRALKLQKLRLKEEMERLRRPH